MNIFTYENYLKLIEMYPDIKNLLIQLSDTEKYLEKTQNTNINSVHSKYDKTFKTILDNKKRVAEFINRMLKTDEKILAEDLEKYKTEFITVDFKGQEADIVYKQKSKNIFFLIEHQSKIDYSMPYRILNYQTEIMRSTMSLNKIINKDKRFPLVVAIVLYSGKKKWNASKYLNEMQDKLNLNDKILKDYRGLGNYNLFDINDYTVEELLKSKSFLDKILILEKAKTKEELVENLSKIISKIKKEDMGDFKNIIRVKLSEIFDNDFILDILKRLGGDDSMKMAVVEMLEKENRRERRKYIDIGKREGIKEGIKGVAKKLLNKKMSIEEVEEITGLKKEEFIK